MKCFRITSNHAIAIFKKSSESKRTRPNDPFNLKRQLIARVFYFCLVIMVCMTNAGQFSFEKKHGFLSSNYKWNVGVFRVVLSLLISYSYHKWYFNSLKLIQNHLITISNEIKGNLFIDRYTYSSYRKSIPNNVAIRDISLIWLLSKCLK